MIAQKILSSLTGLAFLTSFLVVGHGVAPFGTMLTWFISSFLNGETFNPEFVIPSAVACFALLMLLVSLFLSKFAAWLTALIGGVLCGVAFAGFLLIPETGATVIFSLHFLIVEVFLFRYLFLYRPARVKKEKLN